MISLEDGKRLLELAKDTVRSNFTPQSDTNDEELKQRFTQKQGVFVTINEEGHLRGCIGYPQPTYPLYEAIKRAAKHAAFNDPRFKPISPSEIDRLIFEISVLTVPEPIKNDPENVRVGIDGLVIQGAYSSGLLLPQVAAEYKWTPTEFLEHTCEKANLDKDFWKTSEAKIFRFQAQIFTETDKGIVEKKTNPDSN